VIQAAGVFDGGAAAPEGSPDRRYFPGWPGIKMQQSRRLNIEKLQHPCSFHAITPSSILSSRPYI
jgi:hypothetical protein